MSRMCIHTHGHHAIAKKTNNFIAEDMIIQHENQLNSESFLLRDYVTHAQ